MDTSSSFPTEFLRPGRRPKAISLDDRATPLGIGEATAAAELFKAMADPVRVEILTLVRREPAGEVCFCDISDEFDMPQSTLSHHLKILVSAGVLERERRGTWSWYRIADDALTQIEELLRPGGPLREAVPHTSPGATPA